MVKGEIGLAGLVIIITTRSHPGHLRALLGEWLLPSSSVTNIVMTPKVPDPATRHFPSIYTYQLLGTGFHFQALILSLTWVLWPKLTKIVFPACTLPLPGVCIVSFRLLAGTAEQGGFILPLPSLFRIRYWPTVL
ncbi:hypothetical protein F5B21DRAFT_98348 [Xylaria acuta]|nr:hypothetical protein F5B21DRAFT_98348 [Xylaria acuta]